MRFYLSLSLLYLIYSTSFGQNVIYVDHDAAGLNNGSTWVHAYNNLQNAINNSSSGQEIWVAQGIYFPSEDKDGNTNPLDPRDKTFHLKAGVSVWGGFKGTEHSKPTDPLENASVLSGDIGVYGNYSDNAYRVMYNEDIDNGFTSITGFIIEGGNCTDAARSGGAGLLEVDSKIHYSHLWFRNNRAERGGAVSTGDCHSTFNHCQFTHNYAVDYGGAFNNWESCSVILNSKFLNNTAGIEGGGVFGVNAQYEIESCDFSNNTAGLRGGAIAFGSTNLDWPWPAIKIHDVVCEYNSASDKGAAIYAQARPAYYSNVICRFNIGSEAMRLAGHHFLSNVLLHNNPQGGLMASQNSFGTQVKIYNSTLVQQRAAGINAFAATSTFGPCHTEIFNTIIDGNISKDTQAVVNYYNTLIPGSRPNGFWDSSLGADSTGNVDGTPLYFSETNHNYRLWKCSPGINAGDSTKLAGDWPDLDWDNDTTETLLADLSAHKRIWGNQVDIGAYEYSNRTLLRADSNRLYSQIDSASSYAWLNCHTGNVVSTDSAFTFPTDSANSYSLIVSRNSCSDTSICGAFNANINQAESDAPQVNIYPNPARNHITIAGADRVFSKLSLINLTGKIVLRQPLTEDEKQRVNLGHLPNGVYLLRLNGRGESLSRRIVIQH